MGATWQLQQLEAHVGWPRTELLCKGNTMDEVRKEIKIFPSRDENSLTPCPPITGR